MTKLLSYDAIFRSYQSEKHVCLSNFN